MRELSRLVAPLVLAALAACGGDDAEERKVMKPEETVFAPLVTAPDKAKDRTNAALDAHRDALDRQLRESEGEGEGRSGVDY